MTHGSVAHLAGRVATGMTSEDDRPRTRADYERGLPDYHDPTAGWAGAAPTYSALTLRLWLAGVGIVLSIAVGVLWIAIADMIWPGVLPFARAAGLLVPGGWVAHRGTRREPGGGAPGQ